MAWVARINGSLGLLIAMSADTDEGQVQRLVMALQKLGLSAVHHEVGNLSPGKKLSEDAIASLDQVEHLM